MADDVTSTKTEIYGTRNKDGVVVHRVTRTKDDNDCSIGPCMRVEEKNTLCRKSQFPSYLLSAAINGS
jgi:hypothetical protein